MFRVQKPRPEDSYYNQDNVVRHELLLIDSCDRDMQSSPSPNSYRFKLPKPYRNIVRFTLISAQLPQVMFNITNNNNKIDFIVGESVYTTAIDPGFYTGADLATEIQAKMNAEVAGWVVTYDASTRRLSFTNATDSWTILSGTGTHAKIDSITCSAGLGQVDFSEDPDNPADPVIAPFAVDLQADRYCLLIIKSPKSVAGRITSTSGAQNIFAKVVIGSVVDGVGAIDYGHDIVENLPMEWTGSGADVETIEFEFRDRRGNLFDFSGQNHALTLEIVLGAGYNTRPRPRANQGPHW